MSLQIKVSKAASGPEMGGSFSGDPGLFGFLGGAIRKVGGAILGSTPIGATLGGLAGTILGRSSPRGTQPISRATAPVLTRPRVGPGITRFGPQEAVIPKPGVRGAIERFLPGGSTGLVVQGAANGGGCPSGTHPNKSSYRLLSGELVLKGSRCVKNRRRNPMNPRALDRAIGRVVSAKKMSKKLGTITVRKSCPK